MSRSRPALADSPGRKRTARSCVTHLRPSTRGQGQVLGPAASTRVRGRTRAGCPAESRLHNIPVDWIVIERLVLGREGCIMRIGEAAAAVGMTTKAIRFYEDRG